MGLNAGRDFVLLDSLDAKVAGTMLHAIGDGVAAKAMGERGRRRVLSGFGGPSVGRVFLEVYRDVMRGR
jgi:hypothetical protein